METLAMADIWADLIAVVAAALMGWFTRHYQQPRKTRAELVKPNGATLRRILGK